MQKNQPTVRLFQGENRLVADAALGDNVSPDALNCDYSKGTIRKRLGISRLYPNAITDGGIYINNSNSNACVYFKNTRYFDEVHQIEFVLQWWGGSGAILAHYEAGTGGWEIRVDTTAGFQFRYRDTSGNVRTIDSTVIPEFKGIYKVKLVVDWVNDGLGYWVINGTTYASTDISTWDTPAASTRPLYIGADNGATPANQTIAFVIDDLRLYYGPLSSPNASVDINLDIEMPIATNARNLLRAYFSFNGSFGNVVENGVPFAGNAYMYNGGPTFVAGLMPNSQESQMAMQFDGIDDYAQAAYNAVLAPIVDTGTKWTVEGWARLDANYNFGAESTILQIGADGSDCAVWIGFSNANDTSVYYGYSTSTTSFTKHDSGFDAIVGTPFHFAIVRDGTSLKCYINGSLQDSQTIDANSAGDNSGSYGVYMGCRNVSGSYSAGKYCPCTIDEIRIWTVARSATQISSFRDAEFWSNQGTNLIHNWRFNASDPYGDARGYSDLTVYAGGATPKWTSGLLYNNEPQRLLMLATSQRMVSGYDVGEGKSLTQSDILVGSRSSLFANVGGVLDNVKTFTKPTGDSLFSWTTFKSFLIFTNHAFIPQKWRNDLIAHNLTISDQPSAPTAATGGAGNLNDTYTYRVTFRNTTDLTESLASDASASVSPSSQKVVLSSVDTSDDPQVDQRRIWRKKSTDTLYRLVGTIDDNTTTTFTDDETDVTVAANEVLNTLRGAVEPAAVVAVYSNRVWLGNTSEGTSTLRYSEADTVDFPASNALEIDPDDGDEITALLPAFGGLIIFKNHSIHFLTGYGPTTFQVQKVYSGAGCVAHKTVAQAEGVIRFLGIEGIYQMGGDLAPQIISHSQSTLFADLDTEKMRYATAAYHPSKRQYYLSFWTNDGEHRTLVYNDAVQSWALWDIGFDVLELVPTDSNEYRLCGLKNGFVWTIEEGTSDGGEEATSADLTGTSTGSGEHFIDDSGASWPTDNNGLAGCYVKWEVSDGTWAKYLIVGNTATRLYVHADLSNVPSRQGDYIIAGIDWHWQSRYMDMENPGQVKRYYTATIWQAEQPGSNSITLKQRTEQNETWVSQTLATNDEAARVDLNNRGLAMQVRFEDEYPDKPCEIEAFQVTYADRRFN